MQQFVMLSECKHKAKYHKYVKRKFDEYKFIVISHKIS